MSGGGCTKASANNSACRGEAARRACTSPSVKNPYNGGTSDLSSLQFSSSEPQGPASAADKAARIVALSISRWISANAFCKSVTLATSRSTARSCAAVMSCSTCVRSAAATRASYRNRVDSTDWLSASILLCCEAAASRTAHKTWAKELLPICPSMTCSRAAIASRRVAEPATSAAEAWKCTRRRTSRRGQGASCSSPSSSGASRKVKSESPSPM
mmetsp:Transcript_23186/g.65910  ORF Transcript_23186/g.65910 Transcript_23186/m.65910 type:complete len:215 (-) Transcript_23186:22-666(-)